MLVLTGLLIPFAGTAAGAAAVFIMRRGMSPRMQKMMLGFASGVMIAASVWSLLLPAIEMSRDMPLPEWLPAAAGFMGGVALFMMLDAFVPHTHIGSDRPGEPPSALNRTTKLVLAVTLHNIPEGMAVGVVLAGALNGDAGISAAAAMALSVGIAIQNIPEGAIISMPVRSSGKGRGRSFVCGVLSGAVEPAAGFFTILLADSAAQLLPWLLSLAAGSMICVVVEELIPEAQSGIHPKIAAMGLAAGFTLMMVLDVALG